MWGRLDVSPTVRSGCVSTRLSVYPPGTTAGERRALHFHRSWPLSGAFFTLAVALFLAPWPPVLVATTAVALYGGGLWVAATMTRELRAGIRSLSVAELATARGAEVVGDVTLLRTTLRQLTALDALLSIGALDAVEHEARLAAIYESLPAEQGSPSP